MTFRLPDTAHSAKLPAMDGDMVTDGADFPLRTERPTGTVHMLTGWAHERGLELPTLQVQRPSLEDVYLQLVGAPTESIGAAAR